MLPFIHVAHFADLLEAKVQGRGPGPSGVVRSRGCRLPGRTLWIMIQVTGFDPGTSTLEASEVLDRRSLPHPPASVSEPGPAGVGWRGPVLYPREVQPTPAYLLMARRPSVGLSRWASPRAARWAVVLPRRRRRRLVGSAPPSTARRAPFFRPRRWTGGQRPRPPGYPRRCSACPSRHDSCRRLRSDGNEGDLMGARMTSVCRQRASRSDSSRASRPAAPSIFVQRPTSPAFHVVEGREPGV